MPGPLGRHLDTDTLRELATGVLLFVGALATVGGLLGRPEALLSRDLSYLGAVALVVLGVVVGRSAVARFRPTAPSGGLPGPELRPRTDPPAERGAAPSLELYQAEGCPHCRKVRRFCTHEGISVVLHSPRTAGSPVTGGTVTDEDRHGDLTSHGQDQIPLLVDHDRNVALYESDDIVAYLDEHHA